MDIERLPLLHELDSDGFLKIQYEIHDCVFCGDCKHGHNSRDYSVSQPMKCHHAQNRTGRGPWRGKRVKDPFRKRCCYPFVVSHVRDWFDDEFNKSLEGNIKKINESVNEVKSLIAFGAEMESLFSIQELIRTVNDASN
jgi:hypothetical protein